MAHLALKRYRDIAKAVSDNKYEEQGEVELTGDSTTEVMRLIVVPRDGFHQGHPYTLTIKFYDPHWPRLFIDSPIYDRIKTNQYWNNQGRVGEHKGICIKQFSYCYTFDKHFKNLCDNKWEAYVDILISFFNYAENIGKANGIKSNYKKILVIV